MRRPANEAGNITKKVIYNGTWRGLLRSPIALPVPKTHVYKKHVHLRDGGGGGAV